MSIFSQYQLYKNLFSNAVANGISNPVFSQDFKTIQFSIDTDATAAFDIKVFKSNEELPPNLAVASAPGNLYSSVGYTDEASGVFYSGAVPFNPTAAAVSLTFNVETTGSRWVFFTIANYSAGTLIRLDCELFSNHN